MCGRTLLCSTTNIWINWEEFHIFLLLSVFCLGEKKLDRGVKPCLNLYIYKVFCTFKSLCVASYRAVCRRPSLAQYLPPAPSPPAQPACAEQPSSFPDRTTEITLLRCAAPVPPKLYFLNFELCDTRLLVLFWRSFTWVNVDIVGAVGVGSVCASDDYLNTSKSIY